MKRAFTLIELLIVIAIIAILALIAIPNFLESQMRAKVARCVADMRSVATGLESYFIDYNEYPYRYEPGLSHHYDNYSGPINGVVPITSPIAYLTNARQIQDPFFSTPSNEDSSLFYINFLGGARDAAAFPMQWVANGGYADIYAPARILLSGRDSKIFSSNWILVSRGPDREFSDPAAVTGNPVNVRNCLRKKGEWKGLVEQGDNYLYDPTNGSTSRGNILRSESILQ